MSIFEITEEDSENIRKDWENNVCYQCGEKVAYLFDDGRCKKCTRLTPEEVRGDVQ